MLSLTRREHRPTPPVEAMSKATIRVDPIPIASKPDWTAPYSNDPSEAESSSDALNPDIRHVSSELVGLTDLHPGATLGALLPRFSGVRGMPRMTESGAPSDRQARPVRRPPPSYPAEARKLRQEGFVRVRLKVNRRGRVVDVFVMESEPPGVFDSVAVRAAFLYRFEPAVQSGVEIESVVEQRIVFRLQ